MKNGNLESKVVPVVPQYITRDDSGGNAVELPLRSSQGAMYV